MTDYKLSIVIPVYNVEKYLGECLESILNQQHDECEIILVDDGSTDRSGSLCDKYASNYIRVIHKENGGLSSARNAGLKVAKGKYIAFVDSDDRIAEDSIKSILGWIKETDVDVCFMDAVMFYPNGKMNSLGDCIEQSQVRGKTKEEVFQYLSTRPKYPGSACTKLFRRDFLLENNLFFPRDRRLSEDLGYVLDCLLAAEKYDCLNIPYYEYRQSREGSITAQVNGKTFDGMAQFVSQTIEKTCDGKQPKNAISTYALSFVAYEYSIMLWQYSRLNGDDKRQARGVLQNYQWILQYGRTKKIKMVYMLQKVCGLEMSAKILNIYMSHR